MGGHTWARATWDLERVFSMAKRAITPESRVINYQPRQPAQARVYSPTPGNIEAEENATDIVQVLSLCSAVLRASCLIRVLPILLFHQLM